MRVVATEERDRVSGRALDEIWEITAAQWRGQTEAQDDLMEPDIGLEPSRNAVACHQVPEARGSVRAAGQRHGTGIR